MWPSEGVWTLVIKGGATAVSSSAPTGEIASVSVPSRQEGATIPTDVSMTEIDRALRARAGKRA